MGDGGQGFVLPGQVQGVKEGNGITILADGTIEVDSQTIQGVMRLGQTKAYADSAYNKYWWPLAVNGADVGKQLTVTGIDGSGNATLAWADSDGIDWTARGQIIAAIGAGEQNDTLVNIGSARSFLMSQVDNVGNPSGLAYSDVITSAMKVPSGDDSQRPLPAASVPGELRYNTTQSKLEIYNGSDWETVASEDPDVGGYVRQIKPTVPGETDVAAIPAGDTLERITVPTPQEGFLRFNTDPDAAQGTQGTMEFWDGSAWITVAGTVAPGGFVRQTAADGAAVIPAGPDGTRPTGAALAIGEFRYNTTINELEYYIGGGTWARIGPTQGGVRSFVQNSPPTAVNPGDLWYDTIKQAEFVWNGLAWVAPGVTQTGPNASATIPVGTSLQRGPLYEGAFRLNTDTDKPEMYIGGQWLTIPASTSGAFVAQSVPTGSPTETPNAIIPAGSTGDRQTAPAVSDGEMRFNTTTSKPEMYIGGSWLSIPVSASGSFVSESVATTGTNSAVIPAGPNGSQQSAPAPAAGYLRYNSSEGLMEYYDGFSWILIGGSATGSFVDKTVPTAPGTATPNAVIPAGSTADRQTAPAVIAGEFRYNTDKDNLEVYDGINWLTVPSSATGAFIEKTIPTAPGTATPNAVIPAGSTADRQTAPAVVDGEFRLNTSTDKPEMYINGSWQSIPVSTTGSFVAQSIATTGTDSAIIPAGSTTDRQTAPSPVEGYFRYNSTEKQMEYFDGINWILLGGSSTGSFIDKTIPTAPATATPNAVIPAGSTADRQTAPAVIDGEFRLNTSTDKPEMYINGSWQSIPVSTTGSFVAQTVPTAPGTATPNAVIPAGSTGDRQTAPAPALGEFRFNTSTNELEVWNGSWVTVPSSAAGSFVQQSIPTAPAGATPVAIIPSGTTAERQTAPAVVGGEMRFNVDTDLMEVYNGTTWTAVGAPPNAGLGLNLSGTSPNEVLKVSISQQSAPPAAGTLPMEAIDGSLYYDDVLGAMFIRYNNSGSPTWVQLVPAGAAVTSITVDGTNGVTVNGTAAGVTITNTGTATIDFPIDSLPVLP